MLFPIFAASVTCLATSEPTRLTVALGSSHLLNCTYDCSNGFTRAYWEKEQVSSASQPRNGTCVVSLPLKNVSTGDLERNYTCYTENTDDISPLPKIQVVVSLQLQGKRAQAGPVVCGKLWFRVNSCSFQLKPAPRSRPKLRPQQSQCVSTFWTQSGHLLVMFLIDVYYIVHSSATTTAKPEDKGETKCCVRMPTTLKHFYI